MSFSVDEQTKVAYVLNLLTVSISQIIDYNDLNVLEQEYNNIINNFNIQNIPKDETLLDIIKEIMDEIENLRMDEGDRVIVDKEYQHRLKNAIWKAVPTGGAIFATSNPIAMSVTLATQIGIGYMNYRRNIAEASLKDEKEKWKIKKNRMQHLHSLQLQLFETAWRLSDKYDYPEKDRITQNQITEYNHALMEDNPVRRYNLLWAMNDIFSAYPYFWYQLGSTANYIYRNATELKIDKEDEKVYFETAINCFEEFDRINKHSILRKDVITSSWALEFFELLSSKSDGDSRRLELIEQAIKYSGKELDVLELCAFSYLKMKDYNKATDLFSQLVNKKYNLEINIQILSTLYIYNIFEGNASQSEKEKARFGYNQLKQVVDKEYQHYIIPQPADWASLKTDWVKDNDIDLFIKKKEAKKKKEDALEKKVRSFYSKPCCVVFSPDVESVAIEFIRLMNNALNKFNLPSTLIMRRTVDEYQKDRALDDSNCKIIFLGNSKITKSYYKTVDKDKWDYDKFGIHIKQFDDDRAIIFASSSGRDDIDFKDYIAKKKRLNWSLPSINKIPSGEMLITQYKLAIHEYLQLNGVLVLPKYC